MALLSVLRRWHHRDGMPIREIARRSGLSRNTVRKYLASGVVEPKYPQRKTPSKLDEYSTTLNNCISVWWIWVIPALMIELLHLHVTGGRINRKLVTALVVVPMCPGCVKTHLLSLVSASLALRLRAIDFKRS